MTTTIEQAFGSRLMVRGFLLNNELTDFSFLPTDAEGAPVANAVGPGKRPRSSMDPTMVFAVGRRLAYLLGSPGGSAIILFNVKALLALIDWHLDPQAASALVNFGSAGESFLLEPGAAWDGLAKSMQALGHEVERLPAHKRHAYHRRDARWPRRRRRPPPRRRGARRLNHQLDP